MNTTIEISRSVKMSQKDFGHDYYYKVEGLV